MSVHYKAALLIRYGAKTHFVAWCGVRGLLAVGNIHWLHQTEISLNLDWIFEVSDTCLKCTAKTAVCFTKNGFFGVRCWNNNHDIGFAQIGFTHGKSRFVAPDIEKISIGAEKSVRHRNNRFSQPRVTNGIAVAMLSNSGYIWFSI